MLLDQPRVLQLWAELADELLVARQEYLALGERIINLRMVIDALEQMDGQPRPRSKEARAVTSLRRTPNHADKQTPDA